MRAAEAPDHRRAILLLAAVVLAAGLVRTARRVLSPPPPDHAWIEQPGVPVELASDGVYFLDPPATVAALLARARHPCAASVRTTARLEAGARVRVGPRCAIRVDRMPGAARLTLGLRLDPNHDTAADLEALPAIGPHLAREIVRDRERHGPFRDVDALVRVRGVGPATLRAIRGSVVQSASVMDSRSAPTIMSGTSSRRDSTTRARPTSPIESPRRSR